MILEKTAARVSRSMYIIPGGYFIAKLLRILFGKSFQNQEWRTFRFRGIKMKVDLSKQMGSAIYWRGAHDWAPIFALEKLVKPGQTLIDVGANQGEYTLWAARKTGPKGRVYAFEPMKEIFAQLQENVNLNQGYKNFIYPLQIGLSENPGNLQLYTKAGKNEGVNTLYPSEEYNVPLGQIGLDTLDNQVIKLGIENIGLIKVDVEGAELQVLKGGYETIKRFHPHLLIEINRTSCRAAGYEAEDILNFLIPFGYIFSIIGLRGTLRPLPKNLPEFCNIIAIPSSSDQ